MEREKSFARLEQEFPARKAARRLAWRVGVTERLYGFCVEWQVLCLYFVWYFDKLVDTKGLGLHLSENRFVS